MIKETYNPRTGPQVGDYVKIDDYTLPRDFTCRVARVVGKDSEDSYLVEFVESHPKLHDGNCARDKELKGKAHHCWWVGPGNMAPLKVDAMIMNDGDTIYCQRSDKRRITGTATCSKLDEYDPMVGAMIAFARAHGADPTAAAYRVLKAFSKIPTEAEDPTPKKLRLVRESSGNPFGTPGDPTPYKDNFGTPLCVGDLVFIKHRTERGWHETPNIVVETPEDGPFIMGLQCVCDPKTGEIDRWDVRWGRSWKELEPGQEYGVIRVVEAPQVPTAKPKKKRRVIRCANYPGPHSGILGTPTKLVDVRGLPLFVGDVVEIWSDKKGVLGEEPVVQDENHPDQFFVMGCAGRDFTKDGADGGFRIRKVKSFTELRLEETLSDGQLVIKEEEIAPEKKLVLRWSFGEHKLLGNVGDPTPLIDRDGEKLRIGDQVECFCGGGYLEGIEPIVLFKECGPESNGGYYAMGLGSIDFAEGSDHKGHAIRKVKSYTELKPGELLSTGAVEVKEEEVDE